MEPRTRRSVYGALKPLLFRMDPERAHRFAAGPLGIAHRNSAARRLLQAPATDARLAVDACGLAFPGPVGIAAGFDKDAHLYNALLALGFSHVELGTVTPRAQPGNPSPRVQRFPADRALVNAMGFPGPGMEAVARRIDAVPPIGIVGVNVGPNKDTPADDVAGKLAAVTTRLAPRTDYVAINVSSPNTPGLRKLQAPKAVAGLVSSVIDAAGDKPVLLKLHPDAPDDELVATARATVDAGATGIIATNTTKERTPRMGDSIGGGMSGEPLRARSLAVLRALHHGLGRDTPIIGVGGISTGRHVLDAIQAGASLCQIYTGFIYRGPRTATHIHRELLAALDAAGIDRLQDAVGTA